MHPCGNPAEDQRETDSKMVAGKSILYSNNYRIEI